MSTLSGVVRHLWREETVSPRVLVCGVGGPDVVKSIAEVVSTLDSVDAQRHGFEEMVRDGGLAAFGVAEVDVSYGVEEALKVALSSPLMDTRRRCARGAFVHIWGSRDMSGVEAERVVRLVSEVVGAKVPVVCNFMSGGDAGKVMRVMVLLTGVGLTDLYDLEPGVGSEEALDVDLDIAQLEDG